MFGLARPLTVAEIDVCGDYRSVIARHNAGEMENAVRRTISWVAAALVTAAVPANANSPVEPVGAPFQVNTYTDKSDSPNITADASGNFIVVWTSRSQDGSSTGVFGQRYDASGVALGREFQVNTYTLGTQGGESIGISAAADGNFVVAWTSVQTSSNGVFAKRYDNAGATLGGEFQVNAYTEGNQGEVSVGSAANGDFVLVWTDGARDGDLSGVFGRRFNSAGVPLGNDFQVNSYTIDSQGSFGPQIAVDADGDFVVVWTSYSQDGFWGGVFGRRFDRAGRPVGMEFQVNTHTTGHEGTAGVASDPHGNFVVTWSRFEPREPSEPRVRSCCVQAQRYNSMGLALGTEFQVNTLTAGCQFPFTKSLLVDPDGAFVIVWASERAELPNAIFGRRFDSFGQAFGMEFQVSTNTAVVGSRAVVSGSSIASFVVAWEQSANIFAKRFSIPATPTASPFATTPVATPNTCPGDCDGDGNMTVDDVVRLISIALGRAALSSCDEADGNGDGVITIDEVVVSVNVVLNGCVNAPTPTTSTRGSLTYELTEESRLTYYTGTRPPAYVVPLTGSIDLIESTPTQIGDLAFTIERLALEASGLMITEQGPGSLTIHTGDDGATEATLQILIRLARGSESRGVFELNGSGSREDVSVAPLRFHGLKIYGPTLRPSPWQYVLEIFAEPVR